MDAPSQNTHTHTPGSASKPGKSRGIMPTSRRAQRHTVQSGRLCLHSFLRGGFNILAQNGTGESLGRIKSSGELNVGWKHMWRWGGGAGTPPELQGWEGVTRLAQVRLNIWQLKKKFWSETTLWPGSRRYFSSPYFCSKTLPSRELSGAREAPPPHPQSHAKVFVRRKSTGKERLQIKGYFQTGSKSAF